MTYPQIVFQHHWGWEVIQCGPNRFRLICDKHGYIGVFGTCAAAVNYMNNEFMGLNPW